MDIQLIKQLRNQTGAGVMEAKKALEEVGGNLTKAKELLKQKGLETAKKKSQRHANAGVIYSYIHPGDKIGVLLELNCETSFVAKTDAFLNLARELALQIAATNPKNLDALLEQEYIRDNQKTVGSLLREVIAETKENIVLRRFTRYELGSD